MEGELWRGLYDWVEQVQQQHVQALGFRYSDGVVVLVHLWATLHDRPICWACQEQNWTGVGERRPRRLPSQPTMSRRLREAGVRRFLEELERQVRESFVLRDEALLQCLDGKALSISLHSQDPDADVGRGAGGMERGYKFHGLWGSRCLPYWELTPMSSAEPRIARRLLRHLDPLNGGYVLGDSKFDSSDLHRRCGGRGHQLLTAPNRPGKALGHRPYPPERLHALEMLRRPFGWQVLHLRDSVERKYGAWCSFGGGLSPLPSWVRRIHRVRLWICDKLLINAMRIRYHLQQVAQMNRPRKTRATICRPCRGSRNGEPGRSAPLSPGWCGAVSLSLHATITRLLGGSSPDWR